MMMQEGLKAPDLDGSTGIKLEGGVGDDHFNDDGGCSFTVEIDDAKEDLELLSQIVEGCLFVKSDMLSEREISEKLGIPATMIKRALERLAKNYEENGSILRVRNIHDDYWLMDMEDVYTAKIEQFFIEGSHYTKAEVMTLVFIAYSQPIPKNILTFYRGSNATKHVKKWMELGFISEVLLENNNAQLKDLIEKYNFDKNGKKVEVKEDNKTAQEYIKDKLKNKKIKNQQSNKNKKNKRRKNIITKKQTCYITTKKFSGYFDLPIDIDDLKDALEEWKEIYAMLS
ncbi:MAG: SMC-Scp complex subunit ScpB [Promethearchaeota archaeon]